MGKSSEVAIDSIDYVRARVAELRDLELEKEELEARLKEVNQRINYISFDSLVDVMLEKRVPKIRIDGDGNSPPFEAELLPFYRANIAASWEEERKLEAFRSLEEFGASDLIKTKMTFSFPRGKKSEAIRTMPLNGLSHRRCMKYIATSPALMTAISSASQILKLPSSTQVAM